MKVKYNIKNSDFSSDDTNKFQNNISNKNFSSRNFFNKDNGKILNLDYIPKELFSSYMNRNQKDEKVVINNVSDGFNFDSNKLKSSNLDNKNKNDLKSSIKNKSINDNKISQNEINISESYNKSQNILNSNIKINNNEKQNEDSNIHLPGNISNETNINKRYNEEINQSNSKNKNSNMNSNIAPNNIISNIISNESSTLGHNLSNFNGLSDNYINSNVIISNTLTNNSNVLSSNNNYLEKIKLRELESKEKYLIDLESKRNKIISDLIEKQKIEYFKKIKDIEEMNIKNINDNFFIEKDNNYDYNQGVNTTNKKSQVLMNNNEKIINKEKNSTKNIFKNNEIFSYFNKMKQENIKNRRNSNHSTNLNYKTSSSFYTKRTKILSPFISSAITDNNINNNFVHRNYTVSNFNINKNNKKKSKSTKKLISSQKNQSNTSSHLMKTLRSNDYEPANSFQMINLFKNNNRNKIKLKNRNQFYNPKGKEKIQDKYNTYFNCFIPGLYEEQKQKLLNERKIKKAKSSIKIKKLEDYIGPNLYNEEVESPDFGYICYKTNKKINPKYSLNDNYYYDYYKYYNYNPGTMNKINILNNEHFGLSINLRNIYNNYENDKNNFVNENDIFNYPKNNNIRNRNNYFNELRNYPKTEYNDEIKNKQEYNDLYNKAFKQFNYNSDTNFNFNKQPSYIEDIKWNYS